MTGYGNFLYFDKKQDFSLTRVASMLVRINWFPMLLAIFVGGGPLTGIELYYVVPLHTIGFLMTYATCLLMQFLERELFATTIDWTREAEASDDSDGPAGPDADSRSLNQNSSWSHVESR